MNDRLAWWQIALQSVAGIAVGSFIAWVGVCATCRLLDWAWAS